jgi:hypothetical protein
LIIARIFSVGSKHFIGDWPSRKPQLPWQLRAAKEKSQLPAKGTIIILVAWNIFLAATGLQGKLFTWQFECFLVSLEN